MHIFTFAFGSWTICAIMQIVFLVIAQKRGELQNSKLHYWLNVATSILSVLPMVGLVELWLDFLLGHRDFRFTYQTFAGRSGLIWSLFASTGLISLGACLTSAKAHAQEFKWSNGSRVFALIASSMAFFIMAMGFTYR